MRPFDPRLMKYARETRTYILFLAAAGLIMAILVIAQSILISAAASPVIQGEKTPHEVLWIIAVLGGVFAVRLLIQWLHQSLGHRSALKVITGLRTKVLAKAGRQGDRWIAQGHAGDIITLNTRGLDKLEPYFVNFLPQMLLCGTVTPLALAVILWFDWISALSIVLCLPLIPIFMILIGKMTVAHSSERLEAMQRLGTQLLDLLSGLSTLRALGRERGPRTRVNQLGIDYTRTTMRTLYVAFLSGAALEFLATLSTALVAVEVGLRLVYGNISLFVGLTIIMLTPEVFKPLREVGSQFHASADGVAAAQQAFEILEAPEETVDGDGQCPDLATETITVEGLSVEAPGRHTFAPANATFTIEPHSITVLAGTSGSGKSTTVQVLLGFVQPTEGQVRIGSTPLSSISRETLWKQVTWVPQRPAIVPGSILMNLGLSVADERLAEAAAHTGLDEIVAGLPEGWNTFIGHGGVGLSVGQRQRLALTRALMADTQLVILDEPTAHLDAVSEDVIVKAVEHLHEQGKTLVIIAHRSSLLSRATSLVHISSAAMEVNA